MSPAGYIEPERKAKLEQLAQDAIEATRRLDMAIMEAVEVGISLRTIGDAVGLNHVTVRDRAGRMRDGLDGVEPWPHHYPRKDDELFP